MAIKNFRWNYKMAVANGFVGTEEEWLQGIVNPTEEREDLVEVEGTEISFRINQIYNSSLEPGGSSVIQDLDDARLGVVQKIYHRSANPPSFPATWVKLGSSDYVPNLLNVIYAEWCGGTRVEYWITQEG